MAVLVDYLELKYGLRWRDVMMLDEPVSYLVDGLHSTSLLVQTFYSLILRSLKLQQIYGKMYTLILPLHPEIREFVPGPGFYPRKTLERLQLSSSYWISGCSMNRVITLKSNLRKEHICVPEMFIESLRITNPDLPIKVEISR